MVEQHKITCTMLVPVMIYFLLDSPRSATADMSSMETIFYGASPMSPARLKEGIAIGARSSTSSSASPSARW